MTSLLETARPFAGTAEGEALSHARPQPQPLAAVNRAATLALEGVSLTFGGVAALREVDLAFADGRITAVIGPNGAGKTSLINVISGVYTPDRGRIVIKG